MGRAGVGVDNVDVAAATKRGVVVANAPESNVVTAAEHTMALLLALSRNIPQAHASLVAGAWERSKYSGVELLEKTLGSSASAASASSSRSAPRGSGCTSSPTTRSSARSAIATSAWRRARRPDDVYAVADFITVHLPKTP